MKIQRMFATATVAAAIVGLASCSKESNTVSKPEFSAGVSITTDTLPSTAKGTMLKGQTYFFNKPVTVNAGDTLVMQSGVKLLATDPSAILVINGVFISLGTKENPNWITTKDAYNNPTTYKQTTYTDPNTDYGLTTDNTHRWGGIQCGTTATMFNVKFTHIDFAGGTVLNTSPVVTGFGYKSGAVLFATMFQNKDGLYILEDSWIYGTTSDVARINAGTVHFMRNTVEKLGYNDGDAFNIKTSVKGNMAYNLFIGTAKGGTKASAKSLPKGDGETHAVIYMYNNTYINGGYRSLDPDRGANVDIEEGASGYAYNNIMVNCRTGMRFIENPVLDTTDTQYGYSLYYADAYSADALGGIAGQFLPSGHYVNYKYEATNIPAASAYPSGTFANQKYWVAVGGTPQGTAGGTWANGYDGTAFIGKNNPMFVNYPLPAPVGSSTYGPSLGTMTWQGNYDFHLQSSSPAKGTGYTGFTHYATAIDNITVADLQATFTEPGKDMGAFQTDGTGNQHN